MVRVRVPATSANMGAGFDTLGVALGLYNTLEISEIESGLQIISKKAGDYVPRDKNNLVYRAANTVFDTVGYRCSGLKIVQESDIPVTRGLGSSSACIIGGMLAANVISGRQLSYNEILDLAVRFEGHPDNVTPALFGGFCAAMVEDGKTIYKSIKIDSSIKFAVMVPDFFVPTKKSRGALPTEIPHGDAAFNIARAVMFALCMASGDFDNLRAAAEDKIHQPYRKVYIDGMEQIFDMTYRLGSRATYLSGSGPTVLSVLDGGYNKFCAEIYEFFRKNSHRWTCRLLTIDNVGAVVCEYGKKPGRLNWLYE